LDRIDIHLEVPAVPFRELSAAQAGTSSADVRQQVVVARRAQALRFQGSPVRYNAKMTHRQIRQHCRLNETCAELMRAAMSELGLSARAHDKVLRVARTIADLAGCGEIGAEHLNEAINYRMLDRQMWT